MSYRNETLIIRIWLRIRKDHLQMRITQRNYHPSTSMQQMWSYKFLPYYSTPVSWNWFYVSIVLLSYLSVFKILLPCWRRVWSFAMIQCFNLQIWVPIHVLSLKSPGGKGLFVTVWAHAFFINNLFKQSIQNYRMWNTLSWRVAKTQIRAITCTCTAWSPQNLVTVNRYYDKINWCIKRNAQTQT